MIVDVVPLREKGRKLPGNLVLTLRPARGELTIGLRFEPNANGTPYRYVDATLHAGAGGRELLLPLHQAWVGRLRGEAFVVYGTEYHTAPISSTSQYPQAWWCRLVRDLREPLARHSPEPAAARGVTCDSPLPQVATGQR